MSLQKEAILKMRRKRRSLLISIFTFKSSRVVGEMCILRYKRFSPVEKVTKGAYDSKISELENRIRSLAEEKALLECKMTKIQ